MIYVVNVKKKVDSSNIYEIHGMVSLSGERTLFYSNICRMLRKHTYRKYL
jgi:hypothetical protein